MHKILNFINGKLEEPLSAEWIDNYIPATGQVYGQIANSNHADIEQAISAAQSAFPAWSSSSSEERATYLLRLATLIKENAEELAVLEATDNGLSLIHI